MSSRRANSPDTSEKARRPRGQLGRPSSPLHGEQRGQAAAGLKRFVPRPNDLESRYSVTVLNLANVGGIGRDKSGELGLR